MQTGISTASLFVRMKTEDALQFLNDNGVKVAEIFLESFCEYNGAFGKLLHSVQGDVKVHSVHTLTEQFEPQLFSINERARADSFAFLKSTMECAKEVGAKYYTFHGVPRLKKLPLTINFDRLALQTNEVIETMRPYGVSLAYENVHWTYYNYVGFFTELKKRVPALKGTFDVKQARLSGVDYKEFIKEMGKDIVTVHVSDVDEAGKMCLPGRGVTDFDEMFALLRDVGFDGAILLEVYNGDYKEYDELFDSLYYVEDLARRIIG